MLDPPSAMHVYLLASMQLTSDSRGGQEQSVTFQIDWITIAIIRHVVWAGDQV